MSGAAQPPTVFVIDDNATLRRAIRRHLAARADESSLPVTFCETKFVWDLFDKLKPRPGDIAISDLYTAGYWQRAPAGSHHAPLNAMGDSTGNLVLGSVDAAERFLRPLQSMGVDVFLITFVPGWLRDAGRPDLADSLVAELERERLAGVYLKLDQSADIRNFEEVCDRVINLLKRRQEEE
jgi:hypothetical protein